MASVLSPVFAFGARSKVEDGLHFIDENTLLYPVGCSLALFNTEQNNQRFLPPPSEDVREYTALAVSPSKRYVVVAEKGEKSTASIYDLHTMRKRKTMANPEGEGSSIVWLAFSPDNHYIVMQTGAPSWQLYYWAWEKAKGPLASLSMTTAPDTSVLHVTFNPQDSTHLCVTGNGVLKMFRFNENSYKQLSFPKMEPREYSCQVWVSDTKLLFGTNQGTVLFFENNEFKSEIKVDVSSKNSRVNSIVPFSRGFLCCIDHTLFVYENFASEKEHFKLQQKLVLPSVYGLPAETQTIKFIALSPSEERAVCTTSKNQLYAFNLLNLNSETAKENISELSVLSSSFHFDAITGMDVCARRPLLITCGLDKAVRIWDYSKNLSIINKYFTDETLAVAMHPSGFYCLVSLPDKLTLMSVLLDDLHALKDFPIRGSKECRFSNGGQQFACVQGSAIHIFTTYSFESCIVLKGHNGRVRSITWGPDDLTLISCGADGAVYEWDVKTGNRITECVLKSCNYSHVILSSDSQSFYAVGSDCTLKEIANNEIKKTASAKGVPLVQVATTRSKKVLVAATEEGSLRSFTMPFQNDNEWVSYQYHGSPISRLSTSFDEQLLFSSSEDGSVFIFKMLDKDGRAIKPSRENVFTNEVLVTTAMLQEKDGALKDLRVRVDELIMANEYQLRLKDMTYTEAIKDLKDRFTLEIDSLKLQLSMIKSDKDKEEARHDEEVGHLMDRHRQEMEKIESQSTQKLMSEFEKFKELQVKSQQLQQNYENQLTQLEQSKSKAVNELSTQLETKLNEKEDHLQRVVSDIDRERSETKEMTRQIEVDADLEILALKNNYERLLKEERDTVFRLRGDNGVLRKKYKSLLSEIEDYKVQKDLLDTEQKKLHAYIKALERDLAAARKDIEERDQTIQEKEKRIFDFKMKTQELEKFKFVLDYKIQELKRQIEPRENEIKKMKDQMVEMDQELDRYNKLNTKLDLQIKETSQRLKGTENELHSQQKKVSSLETTVIRMKSGIQDASRVTQDPKALLKAVLALHKTYCTEDKAEQHGVAALAKEKDVEAEFARQREFLERNITSLKEKLTRNQDLHQAETAKILKENVILIQEVNSLRKELEQSKLSVNKLESTLKTTQNIMATQSRRGMGLSSTNANNNNTSNYNNNATFDLGTSLKGGSMLANTSIKDAHESSQIEKIIEMQKDEIRKLRETIVDLERRPSSRPSSVGGRLPPMALPSE